MAAELEPILPPPAGEMMLQIMMVTFWCVNGEYICEAY